MAKNKSFNPVQRAGRGERYRGARQTTRNSVGADSTIIRGNCIGTGLVSDTNGQYVGARAYILGNTDSLSGYVPQNLARFYGSGKFLPGTSVKWVPQVGYQTAGRLIYAFTMSPEVYSTYTILGTFAARESFLRGFGSAKSMPLYEERDIEVPTTLRRKLFDTNVAVSGGIDEWDRSAQVFFMYVINGAPVSTAVGNFEYHDHMFVTGLLGQGGT